MTFIFFGTYFMLKIIFGGGPKKSELAMEEYMYR